MNIFNLKSKDDRINELEKQLGTYRRLLQTVIDCKSHNAFNTAGQLLYIQKMIQDELNKEKGGNKR